MRHPFKTPLRANGIRYERSSYAYYDGGPDLVFCLCHNTYYNSADEMVKAHKPGGEG